MKNLTPVQQAFINDPASTRAFMVEGRALTCQQHDLRELVQQADQCGNSEKFEKLLSKIGRDYFRIITEQARIDTSHLREYETHEVYTDDSNSEVYSFNPADREHWEADRKDRF